MVPEVPLDEYLRTFRYIPPSEPGETTMRGEAEPLQTEAAVMDAAALESAEETVTEDTEAVSAKEDVRDRIGLEEPTSEEEERRDRPRFLDFTEPATPANQAEPPAPAIAGPSFLGLNHAPEVDAPPVAGTEPPAESHDRAWTWVAVAALLAVVVLGALEWRAQGNAIGNVPVEGIKAKLQNAWRSYKRASETSGTSAPKTPKALAPVEDQPKPQPQGGPASSNPPSASSTEKSASSDTSPQETNPKTTQSENPQNTAEREPARPDVPNRVAQPISSGGTEATPAKNASQPLTRSKASSDTPAPAIKSAPGAEELAKANNASDSAAAAAWLQKATDKGNPEAPVRLAEIYAKGDGVPRSCQQALALLRTAAAKRNVQACNRLAAMYSSGACVQKDLVKAYRWLSSALAADPNNRWALQNRDLIWQQMTPEERAAEPSLQ